mgnify:CR=1 FL=1
MLLIIVICLQEMELPYSFQIIPLMPLGKSNLHVAQSLRFGKYSNYLLCFLLRYSLQIVADNDGSSEKILSELKKKVFKVETYPVNMVFLVGNFDVQDVNDFNSLLIKLKADLEISAFLYKNCTRLEAVIGTDKIENIIRSLYKKFIK